MISQLASIDHEKKQDYANDKTDRPEKRGNDSGNSAG